MLGARHASSLMTRVFALLCRRCCRAPGYVCAPSATLRRCFLPRPGARKDVYVLDVRLPGMNGRDLCRVLKSGERTRKPVLMISAEASAAFEAGCDDFLAEPFGRSELVPRVGDLRA